MAQFITNRPILNLCLEEKRNPGVQVAKRWWDQEDIVLAGILGEATVGIPEEAEGSEELYDKNVG